MERDRSSERNRELERERRSWREMEHSEGHRKEFSMFVDNIPRNLNQFGLKGIFQKVAERVTPTFPSEKIKETKEGLRL